MTCVEKRHSHRVGSMLHHRFPNGFTDLFMDETDREVSTLTDRAFRSLCVGDEAVYNDEVLYGYSPFSCHKPLVGEPLKKTHHKESKKQGQNKTDKNSAQPWKHQQQKNMSHMSSFLKALSATEESCEGMLIENGGMTDANGESWDKSALRSIQRELSEFSSDYHTDLTGHYKNHHRHPSGDDSSNKTGKDAANVSGKSLKSKHGKSTIKLRKLNIKNFFLHSEFSPFQTWRDLNQFPFGREDTSDSIPKWYDLPFYKELTEAHRKETLHIEKAQSCQKAAVESPPPTAPKPMPPPPPPKVLPKPSAALAEKRCSSESGDGSAAPWRRNRSRAKSVIPLNQPGIPLKENSLKTVDENLWLVQKEARYVDVTAVEEVSSLASTPFSICQLMTPVIPSRQPTETSEILSPSCFDLLLRPHSEAKLTPESTVKRDSYKSLASSILFNLKDNRKRVKSRYSPPKFKTLEVPEGGTQSPQSDHLKYLQACSEGYASGLSTPAISTDRQTVCSPVLELINTATVGHDSDRPLSDDFLLSNLLQTKREAAGSLVEENPIPSLIHSKKTRSPKAKKQNYPSLNLYKKAIPVDSDMKHLLVPLSPGAPVHVDQPTEANGLSPRTFNKDLSPKALPTHTGFSPNTLNADKDRSPLMSSNADEQEGFSSNMSVAKRAPNAPDQAKQPTNDIKEKEVSWKEKDSSGQPMSTMDVIRAAREAINAAKNKAALSNSINKPISDKEEVREREVDKMVADSREMFVSKNSTPENNNILSQSRNEASLVGKKGNVKKEPPPVPKRNFAKSDIQLSLDKQQTHYGDKLTNGDSKDAPFDLPPSENEFVQKQGKLKHIFSARQNNYIKYQRYAETGDEQGEEVDDGDLKVDPIMEADEETKPHREIKDSEQIINDLHALKELQRARLGDRVLENAKSKLGVINIEEEARVKNDLISRELRNIKKGMLSMRGNTTAKRELFAQKEKDQSKQETFTKIDGNVIVNKALINDNYDKAKMALEEIISDRQRRKNTITEQDVNSMFDENADESYVTRAEQRKKAIKDSMTEDKEKQNGSILVQENGLKERLGDLRDHNHMRQILSQNEPRLGETRRSGGRLAVPDIEKMYEPSCESEEVNIRNVVRQISEDSGENLVNQIEDKKGDAPSVPPRSKKGGSIRDVSVTKVTESMKDVIEKDIFNAEVSLTAMRGTGVPQEVNGDLSQREAYQNDTGPLKGRWDVINNDNSKSTPITDVVKCKSILHSKPQQSENRLGLSPEFGGVSNLQADVSPKKEATSSITWAKQKCPLKQDHLNAPQDYGAKNLAAEEPENMKRASEEIDVDAEALSEIPRHIISPLLLVNGMSVNQSPPDQASLSSKSSYFSVESALHRNTETESNVYHSLENLIGEVEEVDKETQNISQTTKHVLDRMEAAYYSLSDHESEPEVVKRPAESSQKKTEVFHMDSKERDTTVADQPLALDEDNLTPMSPSNIFSPTLGIPALFKVKDNTFTNKFKLKTVQPWSPRGILSGSERREEVHQIVDNPELAQANEPATRGSAIIPDEVLKPKESPSNSLTPKLQSPSNLLSENPKKLQVGGFLTVPQEEDRLSGLSPSSEAVESLPVSPANTADEIGINTGVLKVPSERSGSTCSGNESQSGLPKPPVVLPKSEKAVLKAIKLANRRIKKEEAQKSSHKSSQSSSKHRVDRHKSDKSEHGNSSSKSNKNSERNHGEKTEDSNRHRESHQDKNNDDRSEKPPNERHSGENNHHDRPDALHKTRRQSHDSVESNNHANETLPSVATERQGRSSSRRERPEQRHYSSDRVISNVPVYKTPLSDRPPSDRPVHRSQSIDRYLGGKVERRVSADTSGNEKLDPRTQRIEKSIMDELQQRGRAKDKTSRDTIFRRSHSIDAYPHPRSATLARDAYPPLPPATLARDAHPHPPPATLSHDAHPPPSLATLSHDAYPPTATLSHDTYPPPAPSILSCDGYPHTPPATLSRQSSHTSQHSRQSSIEHTIVAQSFPLTQRKLLQDPDSGQYFFVDMPFQVKTKTFFDPETGSYVQLPVQPPEGAVPQASHIGVLTPPLVVYHSFVPVPLSPMAQKATIQAPHMEPRLRQMHYPEGTPYLEPVYGQHDHMLGEFLGTEELDCPS
ncbi:uncharacterized protein [Clinocottus analis]|uniref:uncharacterized protein n=1 Tax=Clinocottus analis TaxID=304258 RepID=UPI0035BF07C2